MCKAFNILTICNDIKYTQKKIWCNDKNIFRNLSIPKATSAKRVSQILLAVEYLEGLDNPVLKWSLPDNSHVCLVSDSSDAACPDRDHVSRDMAVSCTHDKMLYFICLVFYNAMMLHFSIFSTHLNSL